MFSQFTKKNLLLLFILPTIFLIKIFLNYFLMAENGDTYDFFKVAYEYNQGNFLTDSKRMPLFPILISVFNDTNYVVAGRVLNNLFYLGSLVLFFHIIKNLFNLDFKNNLLYTTLFGFFYLIFDNSFFIMSDTLFLFLTLLFIYLYYKNVSTLTLTLIGFLAFYTRFEGILLITGLIVLNIFNKKYSEVIRIISYSFLLILPFLYKNFLLYGNFLKLGYLEDAAGFTLNFTNILKAFGTLIFLTGGFWFLPILLSRAKDILKIDFRTFLPIVLVLFTSLLITWGFYIRLYSIPLFVSFLIFIYFLENYQKPSKNYILVSIFSFVAWVFIAHFLNHIDLAETKISKGIVVLFSSIILYFYYNYQRFVFSKILIILMIIILNLSLFITKFIETREKYYTLVLANSYAIENSIKNVGYADESGVTKWYLKDFNQEKNFINSKLSFGDWLISNNIEYFIYTEELGFQDKKLKPHIEMIKNSEKIIEFRSNFAGGKTVIYKLR